MYIHRPLLSWTTWEEQSWSNFIFRFYKAADVLTAEREVVPLLRDDVQLTVDEYRNKLYEVRE